jgi:glycerol kinase
MSKFILSIDQGTTGTTVSILNHAGILVAKHNQEFPQIFPKPGWVEHNPEDIWKSTITSIKKCLEASHLKGSEIAAIGITNQRETVVIWDRKNWGSSL